MNIEPRSISVRQLVDGYDDKGDDGVVGYAGRLDIRPPYQREFVYKDKQRDAVVDTIIKGFPLNVMYWAVREDGGFEIIDGQQRTISISQYCVGDFAFNKRYFQNLRTDEQQGILDYKLMVYLCSGTDSERLDWFRVINIAGVKLTDQELRNAVYAGSWVSDSKRYFSKRECPAYQIGSAYLNRTPERQEYLETAISWISNGEIEEYMAEHQHDPNATALWRYYQSVINWVSATFPKKRDSMKGVDWGGLYDNYKDEVYDVKKIEEEVSRLILDDEVTSKSGIYPYILTRNDRYLNLRAFTPGMKQRVYEKQKGICAVCHKHFDMSEMEADHIDPWHDGGKTTEDNCQLLCKEDNRRKSGK